MMYACIHVGVDTYMCRHTRAHMCMDILHVWCMYVFMWVWMCAHMYGCFACMIYVCSPGCGYVYICVHMCMDARGGCWISSSIDLNTTIFCLRSSV